MFESDWLDVFSRTPWWTVPLIWLPCCLAVFAWSVWSGAHAGLAFAMALLGWLIWTFTEYSLHRTVFHWKPDTSWGPRMHFLLHGVHHQWVRDRFRLVMPPAVSLLLGGFFGMCFRTALGPVWGWAMFSGFLWGYMVYDVTHYATHHLKFRHPWFLALKKHHLQHHHNPRYKDLKFGVSTTLWDRIFRTY
jgi:sterol desaturase/sphingolipid hydroxylase (fatty acid hydroxylase superfamily)